MSKRRQLRGFDLKQIAGFDTLIGVDEAGRGALAGPVVAGAVRVSREFLEGRWAQTRASKVNDSKQLSPEQHWAFCSTISILPKYSWVIQAACSLVSCWLLFRS